MAEQRRRGAPLGRAVLALLCAAAAWDLLAQPSFVGPRAPIPRGAATQMQGYRLDWMLEKRDGTSDLQPSEGFFIGERGFEKSQNAQGLRYRMRPMPEEYKKGIEVDGLMFQIGPFKLKLGEAFGGSGNNAAHRALKKKIAQEGITDPKKKEENEYWLQKYGHKRWVAPYVDQSTGTAKQFFRGLAAWSGFDPLKEERGKTWIEADYGKPWLAKYIGTKEKGWVTAEQVQKEINSGKLLKK